MTQCFATLDISELSISDISNMWYANERQFDLLAIQPLINQFPACELPILYNAYVLDPNTFTRAPLPTEVDLFDNVFTLKKCNPIGFPSYIDNECNDRTVPYEKRWTITLEITLDDGVFDQVAYTTFDAIIEDPCKADVVSFSQLQSEIAYELKTPAEPYVYEPRIQQAFALCPMSCSLNQVNNLEIDGSSFLNFQVISTEGSHSSLKN